MRLVGVAPPRTLVFEMAVAVFPKVLLAQTACPMVPVVLWQPEHSMGRVCTKSLSALDPWGAWQFMQFSLTGACSHKNGPRFSVWQV